MEIADDPRSDRLTLFIDIGHNNSLSQSLCDKSLPYGIMLKLNMNIKISIVELLLFLTSF